jgi:hypothetical protein
MKWSRRLARALLVVATVGTMVLTSIAEATWG